MEGLLLLQRGWTHVGGRRYEKIKHDPGYTGIDLTHSAEVEVTTQCEQCGETFYYQYITGYSSDDSFSTSINRKKVERKALNSTPEPHKCPNCGHYQKWMRNENVKKYIGISLRQLAFFLIIGPLIVGLVETLIWMPDPSTIDFLSNFLKGLAPSYICIPPWLLSFVIPILLCYISERALVHVGSNDGAFSENHINEIGPQFYKFIIMMMIPVMLIIYFIVAVITLLLALLNHFSDWSRLAIIGFPTLFISIIAFGAAILLNISAIPKPEIPIPKINEKTKTKIGLTLVILVIFVCLYGFIFNPQIPESIMIPLTCLIFAIFLTGLFFLSKYLTLD